MIAHHRRCFGLFFLGRFDCFESIKHNVERLVLLFLVSHFYALWWSLDQLIESLNLAKIHAASWNECSQWLHIRSVLHNGRPISIASRRVHLLVVWRSRIRSLSIHLLEVVRIWSEKLWGFSWWFSRLFMIVRRSLTYDLIVAGNLTNTTMTAVSLRLMASWVLDRSCSIILVMSCICSSRLSSIRLLWSTRLPSDALEMMRRSWLDLLCYRSLRHTPPLSTSISYRWLACWRWLVVSSLILLLCCGLNLPRL